MNSTQSAALNESSSLPGDSAEGVNDDASSHRSTTDRPSPHTVRLFFLTGAWNRISRANRVLVVTNLIITIAQLVSIITALVISRNQYCDRPLDVFLIVYLVRSIVNAPLVLYHNLRPANQPQQQQPSAPPPPSSSDESASPPSPAAAPDSSTTTQATNNARTPRREWTDRVKSLLDIFGVVWFIIGNYFLFTSGQCVREAPSLFYTALVWILLGYLLVLVPLFLCISVIFCLPCVLVLMRTLRLGYATGLVMGATKEEIANVPVYKYKSDEGEQPSTSSTAPTSPAAPAEPEKKKRPSIFRWFFLRRPKDPADTERNYEPITITPAEDAVCSICLSEYEQDDLVCKLWCGHHFHKDCVHEWLALNSSCPLCKRDFRSKNDSS